VTVAELEEPETAREKSSPWPVPVIGTLWGLPGAPSVIVNAALLDPPAEGVNVTLTVQLAPALSELPQVLVSA
jgi:hypothetical protein